MDTLDLLKEIYERWHLDDETDRRIARVLSYCRLSWTW